MSKSMVSLKINSVVAVLTENLSSLNHCRKTRKGHLRCFTIVFCMDHLSLSGRKYFLFA
jgi:hypothetical protein